MRKEFRPKPTRVSTHESRLSTQVYDAIKQARHCFEEKRNALHPIVERCEQVVNSHKEETAIMQQFLQSKWLNYCSTSHHYYIQLA